VADGPDTPAGRRAWQGRATPRSSICVHRLKVIAICPKDCRKTTTITIANPEKKPQYHRSVSTGVTGAAVV
jgi:hypothetical protein